MEAVRKFFIETLLQLHRSSCVERDLKEDTVIGAMDAEIVTIKRQGALATFGNHLEAITLGNVKNIHQGLVDNFPDLNAIFLRFSFDEVDPNKSGTQIAGAPAGRTRASVGPRPFRLAPDQNLYRFDGWIARTRRFTHSYYNT